MQHFLDHKSFKINKSKNLNSFKKFHFKGLSHFLVWFLVFKIGPFTLFLEIIVSKNSQFFTSHLSLMTMVFKNVQYVQALGSPKIMTRSLVPGWTHLRVHQMSSCGSWDRRARSRLPTLERGRGSSWEPRD
jgi:hypothetical protein